MSKPTLKEIEATLKAAEQFKREARLYVFEPYDKQREFYALGLTCPERMLRAGNQEGKTEAAAYETACHLTGIYPNWWPGRRFTKAPRGWLCGVSSLLVRDTIQSKLCGRPGDERAFGTGMIPKNLFAQKPSVAHGVANAYDTIVVRHVSGENSSATFKSYEQGVTKFQAEPLDFIWLDEEPDEEIYSECITRTTATGGMVYMTYTPLKGMTKLTRKFMKEKPAGVGEVHMTIYDAKHILPEQRDRMIGSWPEHEREARAMGMPFLGSNAVFENVSAQMLRVPLHVLGERIFHAEIGELDTRSWGKLWAIDFGIAHPFAAVLLAWDRDYDVIYVLHELKIKNSIPKAHAERMRAIAANVPVAWPHDGNQRDKGSGKELAKIYKDEGLVMLPRHATFADGGYSTEAGIMELLALMRSERFKVSGGCNEWFDEFHSYYRKDGLIVKENDDLMSATRIGVMQIRSALVTALGSRKASARAKAPTMCRDVDFDPF